MRRLPWILWGVSVGLTVVAFPLLAIGGFGLVSAVSAALVVPLAVVWLTGARPAISARDSS